MRVALDTNRYSDLCSGVGEVAEMLEGAEAIFLPFVVVAELRAGFLAGTRQRENERALRLFLGRPGVGVLYADDMTTRQYAIVLDELRRRGTPIPINDLWIAALVLQHDLYLCARDRHFDNLPQIPRL